MKVAVGFYGQPRFVNVAAVVNSIKSKILDRFDCDVFAHLWYDPNAVSYDAGSWSNLGKDPVLYDAPAIFQRLYNPVKMIIEKPRRFKFYWEKEYLDKYFTGKNPHWNADNYSNVLSQFYSIEQVYKLIYYHPEENYDFLVLIRTDLIMEDFPDLNQLPSRDPNYAHSVYVDGRYGEGSFPAQCMILSDWVYAHWVKNLYSDGKDICESLPVENPYPEFIQKAMIIY